MDNEGQLTWDWVPRVLVHFPNGRIAENHLGHLIIGTRWPEDLCLLTLRVGNYLAANISLVSCVEDINAHVDDEVSEVDLLIWLKTKLLDSKCFSSRETWHTAHHLLDVSALHSVVPWSLHLTVELLDIFHRPGAIVGRDRAGLSDRVYMAHVVDRQRWIAIFAFR